MTSEMERLDKHRGQVDTRSGPASYVDTGGPGRPVLFVHGSQLDSRVRAEISRVIQPSASMGVVLTGTVSASIARALTSMGYSVSRRSSPYAPTPDALAGSPSVLVVSERDRAAVADYQLVARATNSPVLFVSAKKLSATQRATFNAMARGNKGTPTVYAFGGDAVAAVNGSWSGRPSVKVVNLSASDPATESSQALRSYSDGPTTVALVSSVSWQMQLIAAQTGSPVLLVDPKRGLSSAVTQWLTTSAGSIARIYAFGDSASISDRTLATAAASISGPAGTASATFPVVN